MNKIRKAAVMLLAFAMCCTSLPQLAFAVTQKEQAMEEIQTETGKPDIQKKKAKESNNSVRETKTVKSDVKKEQKGSAQSNLSAEEKTAPDIKRNQPEQNTLNRGVEKNGNEIDSTGESGWVDLDLSEIEAEIEEDTIYSVQILQGMEPYLVYLFTPERSGYYTFFSEGPYDTYGMIGDEDGYLIGENDDRDYEDDDYNFAVSAYLFAGCDYYCVAQMNDSKETGFYHCMISSDKSTYHISEDDIQKLEIIDFPREQFYKPESNLMDMPFEDCGYRITFTDGQTLSGYFSSNILGLPAGVRFKYPSEEDDETADLTRDDNALIYNIAGIDAEEMPITYAESPIAALEIVTMPHKTTVPQIYSDDIINRLDGLSIRIRYKDGTENMLYWEEDGYYMEKDDHVDAYPTWSWKKFDEELQTAMTGENAVVISYLDQSVEAPITVLDSTVTSISVVKNPAKSYYGIYEYGEDIDLYGMVLWIFYGDNSSEQVTVTEHGRSPVIGKYQLSAGAFFVTDEDDYLTGEICVTYGYETAYYNVTLQTYADLRKEAVQLVPGQITRVSLNQNAIYRVFRFTPLETKYYEFYTLGDCDTYLDVVGADGSLLASDDDSGGDGNCYIECGLLAGRTYYFVVSMYKTGETGNFACKLGGAAAYTITYNLNGGVNHSSNPSLHYNQTILLQNPTRPQYVFEGWYMDSAYRNRITQITAGSRQNYVLYAKWRKVAAPGKVKLKSASNHKSKKILVKYKKSKNVAGYEIAYATNRKFKKASSVVTGKTKATVGKLKKGKTYYVRVCAYNLDSTGQKVRGKWSSVKKVIVKK